MVEVLPDKFYELLPVACRWVEAQEKHIIERGKPISAKYLKYAKSFGISQPEKIRVLGVSRIPMPNEPVLYDLCVKTNFIFSDAIAMALRNGIYVRNSSLNDEKTLLHELAHVAQYERLGGIANFLRQYVLEIISFGYYQSPLELEARKAEDILSE